jgi:glycerol-3-phosphate cytidylyltransferase
MKFNRGIIAGAFDLIHPGYVRMFKDAKQVCAHLTVALHSNPCFERAEKYPPVQSLREREEVLLSIRYIDNIVFYETEQDLIEELKTGKYELRILGADYKDKAHTGEYLKISVHYVNRNHQYSTTDLKLKIYESVKNHNKSNI